MKRIILIFLILYSCTPNPYKHKTEIFSCYLKEIGKEIPKEKHLYILAPSLACLGCVQTLAKNVDTSNFNTNRVTIITSKSNLFPEATMSKKNFYLDTNQDLDYLNLDIYNITLFETSNSNIDNIIQLEAEDGAKLVANINKYK